MELRDVVRARRMVRHFTPEPVAPEVIDRILDLARHAPSAGFTQGQSFIVYAPGPQAGDRRVVWRTRIRAKRLPSVCLGRAGPGHSLYE